MIVIHGIDVIFFHVSADKNLFFIYHVEFILNGHEDRGGIILAIEFVSTLIDTTIKFDVVVKKHDLGFYTTRGVGFIRFQSAF